MAERMRTGEWYIADDPDLARASRRARELMDAYNLAPSTAPERERLLAELLGWVGPEVAVRPPLYVDFGTNIRIGARTFVNNGLTALDVATITIGEDVQIGPHVQLLTPTHPVDPGLRRDKWEAGAPVVIGDNVWLGGGAIVLPGVTVGADTVVGAGSVVTRDLPAGVVAAGNPARIVRRVDAPRA